jgi:hypothetical protein
MAFNKVYKKKKSKKVEYIYYLRRSLYINIYNSRLAFTLSQPFIRDNLSNIYKSSIKRLYILRFKTY